MNDKFFAAVGDDGTRPVVWGLGATEGEARENARRWLAEGESEHEIDDLECHTITAAQRAVIEAGDVSWPVSPRCTEDQIKTLRREAAQAGDTKQVKICDAAIDKGEGSSEWAECVRVIADAAAQCQ